MIRTHKNCKFFKPIKNREKIIKEAPAIDRQKYKNNMGNCIFSGIILTRRITIHLCPFCHKHKLTNHSKKANANK